MPDTGGEIGLPPLFPIRGFEGSTADYLNELYAQYRRVVGEGGLRLRGKPVVAAGRQGSDGRDKRFWHLITEVGRFAPRRSLSLRRCAWLPRVLWVLKGMAAGDPRCIWWRENRRDLHGIPLDVSCHLVLRERTSYFMLATAYTVDNDDRRARLIDRAAESWRSGDSARRD